MTALKSCENDLLQNIVKRRQFKLRGVEMNIIDIKNLLLPFANQKEYKDKERELQETFEKYDTEIQAKKQKKFKSDVLDYKDNKVYKWQGEIEEPEEKMDDASMDDSPSDATEDLNPPRGGQTSQLRFEHTPVPRRRRALVPLNYHQGRPNTIRDNLYEPLYPRTPDNLRLNIPINNRFSPIEDDRCYTPYWQWRGDFKEERVFFPGRTTKKTPKKMEGSCPIQDPRVEGTVWKWRRKPEMGRTSQKYR